MMDRPLSVLVRPTSDISVLPARIDLRVAALEDEHLPLDGVDSIVYCASMGFGYVPHVLAQCEAAGVKRGLFVSTTAIFTQLPAASREPRVAAETAVRSSALDWTIVRPTMIYGTARDRNISRLLRFLARSPAFPLCGNALWQPIYVEDLADAVVAALDTPSAVRRIYNVAGAYPIRFDELVRTAARALRRRVLLVPVPLAAAVLAARLTRVVTEEQIRRLAEDKAFDITEATRDFGFHPRSFTEGVNQEARALGL
jgi:nucleoside-diphosphate-sugar epimerase